MAKAAPAWAQTECLDSENQRSFSISPDSKKRRPAECNSPHRAQGSAVPYHICWCNSTRTIKDTSSCDTSYLNCPGTCPSNWAAHLISDPIQKTQTKRNPGTNRGHDCLA